MNEEDERGTVAKPYEEDERIEWPGPAPEPEREPSHPGAKEGDSYRGADT